MKTLFLSPHPDDVEIAVGGLMYRMAREGAHFDLAICTGVGDLSMAHSGETVSFSNRMDEQAKSAQILNVENLIWLHLAAASKFDLVPQSKFVVAFDQLFTKYDAVFLPMPSYNSDHTVVWNAAMSAIRPGRVDGLSVYAYEQCFSNAVGVQLPGREFGKRYYALDDSDIAAKENSILCHHSQMHGREGSIYGPEVARTFARLRGSEVGTRYAEMVYLIRERV